MAGEFIVHDLELEAQGGAIITASMMTLHCIISLECQCARPNQCTFPIKKVRFHATRGEGGVPHLYVVYNDGRKSKEVSQVRIIPREMCQCQPAAVRVVVKDKSIYFEGAGDFNPTLPLDFEF